jgi:hypothetical protein
MDGTKYPDQTKASARSALNLLSRLVQSALLSSAGDLAWTPCTPQESAKLPYLMHLPTSASHITRRPDRLPVNHLSNSPLMYIVPTDRRTCMHITRYSTVVIPPVRDSATRTTRLTRLHMSQSSRLVWRISSVSCVGPCQAACRTWADLDAVDL